MTVATAPELDRLTELADNLRDHVFTLVQAGDMKGALILIRADAHSAAAALAADGAARYAMSEPIAEPDKGEEPDEDTQAGGDPANPDETSGDENAEPTAPASTDLVPVPAA